MRIDEYTRQIIRNAVHRHLGTEASVRLFGSRANDEARGGDIDLYIEAPAPPASERWEIAGHILQDILRKTGDRKIDIIIRLPGDRAALVDQEAKSRGILL